jgi:hypothetical protein
MKVEIIHTSSQLMEERPWDSLEIALELAFNQMASSALSKVPFE